jgi:transglutaminase-like putative cysteine protease
MLNVNPDQRLQSLSWRLWGVQLCLCWLLSPSFSVISLGCFIILLLFKFMQLNRHWRSWQLTEANLVALPLLVLFVVTHYTEGVLAIMIHLLYLAALLRLLGFRTHDQSDVKQLLLVHYVLFACVFILQQDVISALAVLVVLLLQFSAHYLAFASQPLRLNFVGIGKTTAVMLPLWALLFLFLPRLPPLWQLPSAGIAQTGLAASLSAGSITQLVESDALVFRAEFTGKPPEMPDLYWRARVYVHFDGEQWHQPARLYRLDINKVLKSPAVVAATASPIEYKLLLEPHQQRHLFTLAQPLTVPEGSRLTTSSLLLLQRPLLQQSQLTLQSQLLPVQQDGPLNGEELQLPMGNPASRVLAQQLLQQANKADVSTRPTQLVQLIQQYLQQGGFVYSLTPPPLTGHHIDQFLFQSKTGFCSHYAQAAAFILRAAGVPSRIVGGYLGGSWQAGGRYLQVRQKEAHAWVEYYQQGQWLRFDPTIAVAPERAYRTLDDLFAVEPLGGAVGLFLQNHWQRWLLQPLADLDYFWSRWILGFNAAQQWQLWQQLQDSAGLLVQQIKQFTSLLSSGSEQLALTSWLKAQSGWMLLSSSLLLLLGLVIKPQVVRRIRQKQLLRDPAAYLLQRLPISYKQPGQSIQSLLAQLALANPAFAPQLQRLLQLYQQLNFAGRSSQSEQQELLQLLEQLQREM